MPQTKLRLCVGGFFGWYNPNMRTQQQYSLKRKRDDDTNASMKRPRNSQYVTYSSTMPRWSNKNAGSLGNVPRRQPSANYNMKRNEIKMVDCYIAGHVAKVAEGVAPNAIDVYSYITGSINSNETRNLFPCIAQGTARNQRIGTKVRAAYMDLYMEIQSNSEKEGDTWRVSLCKVHKNGGNNGASYGSRVYGSSSNAGGIGVGSGMPSIFWPRNEDYMQDFKVIKEWDVDTISKGMTMIPAEGDTTAERYDINPARIKDHINLGGDLLQWTTAGSDGDIVSTVETSYFFLVRGVGRQTAPLEVVIAAGIRVGYYDV